MKDYQGSLALSIVGNGYGSSFAYHPYGAQNLVRTDGQPPSEQYTGKEWSGTYEFYYYGARFMDPVLGMWSVPDPAGQFANPYAFGGNPINYTDPDGEFLIAAVVVGAVIGAYYGGVAATGSYTWKGFDIKKDWDEMLIGAVAGAAVGGGAAYVGAAAGASAVGGLGMSGTTGTVVAGGVSGAVGGGLAGAGNAFLFGRASEGGFMDGKFGSWDQTWKAGVSGMAVGGVLGAIGGAMEAYPDKISKGILETPKIDVDGQKIPAGKILSNEFPGLSKFFGKGVQALAPIAGELAVQNVAAVDIFAGLSQSRPAWTRWNNFSGTAQNEIEWSGGYTYKKDIQWGCDVNSGMTWQGGECVYPGNDGITNGDDGSAQASTQDDYSIGALWY